MRAFASLFRFGEHMARPQSTSAKSSPPQKCPKGALHLEHESASAAGRGVWYARVPADHTIDDVLNASYFGAHQHERGLREGDIVDIEPESALWRIQVRVMACDKTLQQVELREAELYRQSYEAEPPQGFEFKWDGNGGKWCAYKGAVLVAGGFSSQSGLRAKCEELIADKVAA